MVRGKKKIYIYIYIFDSSAFFKLFLVAGNQAASSSRSTIQETTLYPGRKSKSSLVVSPKWVSIQDNYESFAQDVTYSSRSSSFIILLLKWKTCFPLVSIILDRNLTCGTCQRFCRRMRRLYSAQLMLFFKYCNCYFIHVM